MSLRLLIDECLSPDLVDLAVAAGHVESTCLRDRGLLGTQDWTLVKHVLAEDFTLVTVNAHDFRGSSDDAPGGLYATTELHAGLVCLTSVRRMDLNAQRKLFEIALKELAELPDLINQVLEVREEALGEVVVTVYELPPAVGEHPKERRNTYPLSMVILAHSITSTRPRNGPFTDRTPNRARLPCPQSHT